MLIFIGRMFSKFVKPPVKISPQVHAIFKRVSPNNQVTSNVQKLQVFSDSWPANVLQKSFIEWRWISSPSKVDDHPQEPSLDRVSVIISGNGIVEAI